MAGLPTAPCTQCRRIVVYGQRSCMQCGASFQYGPQPPPEPTPAQIQEALATALATQPAAVSTPPSVASPSGPPPPHPPSPVVPGYGGPGGPSNAFFEEAVDTGRYDHTTKAQVTPEAIPGFVDSTLFKAFTPRHVETERVEGLEATGFVPVREAPPGDFVPLETTSYGEVGLVATEAIPGFVDSTLFKAFTPSTVQTENVDGFEAGTSATSLRPARRRTPGETDTACSQCGTLHQSTLCPTCGARRRGD